MSPLFDFTVDKATNSIHITREFAADIDLVWDAFTKAEILDQWFGPKPMRVQTKVMDFRVGGRWMYSMVSADNAVVGDRYSLAEFIEIHPKTHFTSRNSFRDTNGDPLPGILTSSITTNSFQAAAGKTTVTIVKKLDSLAQLEQFVAGGHYETYTSMAMGYLDEYFLTLGTAK